MPLSKADLCRIYPWRPTVLAVPRLPILFLSAALAVAACAGSASPATTTGNEDATTTTGATSNEATQTETTMADEDVTTTSSAPDATSTSLGRPAAPDFTLELGDGGTYTLSEGAKPVYLVFWAEW